MTHNYLYAGGQLLRETYGDNTLDFFYDAGGCPYALKYNGTTYYYITNLQGDVMYLVDAQGNTVASYDYDPYGNIVSGTGTMADVNPLRYRGYYYDAELEMYYLQSRYYDPQIGRFLNADSQFDTAAGCIGYNLFAYCANSPVTYADVTGEGLIFACVLVFGGIGALVGGHIAAKASKNRLGYVNGWWVAGGILAGGGTGALIGWGVGAAATAIGATMTAGSSGTLGVTIYQNWQTAEQSLRNLIKSVSSVAERTFSTPWGNRIVDAFNSSKRIIAEAKYGYQGLSQFIRTEIMRDAWLLDNKIVKSVEWHFYVSQATGKGGPSGPLLEALFEAGIKVIFH